MSFSTKFLTTLIATLFLVCHVSAQAESSEPSPTPVTDPTEIKPEPTSRELRALSQGYVFGTYSSLDLILPSKLGVTAGWVQNVDTSAELEYMRGSYSVPFLISDLGSMVDERVSLNRRSYFGTNSFNVSYGISYFSFRVEVGDAILSRISSGVYPSSTLLELSSLGLNVGVGNRWSLTEHLLFSVDWISWYQPILVLKREAGFLSSVSDPVDKSNINKAMDVISYFPRFAAIKVQLGWSF